MLGRYDAVVAINNLLQISFSVSQRKGDDFARPERSGFEVGRINNWGHKTLPRRKSKTVAVAGSTCSSMEPLFIDVHTIRAERGVQTQKRAVAVGVALDLCEVRRAGFAGHAARTPLRQDCRAIEASCRVLRRQGRVRDQTETRCVIVSRESVSGKRR